MSEPEELTGDFEFIEATSYAEFIACAFNSICATDDIDEALLENKEKAKIRLIRSKSISIIYKCINELYDELFEAIE